MNAMIAVTEENGRQAVNARELHTALDVGRDFSTWIKDRIEKYSFIEGTDYQKRELLSSPDSGSPKARPQTMIEYLLSISTAKEIAMVENNARGREVRQYLIHVEEAWNSPAMVMARAVQVSQKQIEAYRLEIAALKPKGEFYDAVAGSGDAISMRDAAAALNILGWGRNKLFSFLRKQDILDSRNIPYREYQDREYFRVIEQKWTDGGGETHISLKTLVYQKGLEYLRNLINRHGETGRIA